MGVERISFVKDMCKQLGKAMPAVEDIPDTSISTDLKRFVRSLPEKPAPAAKKASKKVKKDGDKDE
tara:strand:+ start:10936 stop:11133 length:198 start_codon:yes stop_codon:yes gene_type:complete